MYAHILEYLLLLIQQESVTSMNNNDISEYIKENRNSNIHNI